MSSITLQRPIAELTDAELKEARRALLAREPGAVLRRLSDIQPVPVHWLWPSRIALGKLTLIVGDPGLGKSLLTLDLAARVTTGRAWPDKTPNDGAGSVLLLNAEDDAADTIRPRLDAASADSSRVHVLEAVRVKDDEGRLSSHSFSLADDLGALEEAIRDLGDVRLVVIDPISAYLDGVDSHVNTEVRGILGPVAALAARSGAALVGVHHLNKGAGAAIYRTSGSIAFVAAARAVWAVGRDSADDTGERRLFLPVKNNLGPDSGGLAFTLNTDGGRPTVAWGEAVHLDATDALASDPDGHTEGADARSFLLDFLSDGPRAALEVLRAARAAGHAEKTLRRAKRALAVRSAKLAEGWTWALPGQDGQGGQDSPPGNVGHLGHLETKDDLQAAIREAGNGGPTW